MLYCSVIEIKWNDTFFKSGAVTKRAVVAEFVCTCHSIALIKILLQVEGSNPALAISRIIQFIISGSGKVGQEWVVYFVKNLES